MGICVSCRRRERKAPEKRSVPGAGGPAKGAAAAELLPRRVDRLPMMANSMSNIKMTNPIKGIVSKRRRRYMKDGFNLDLAYITDRLIAMGFPAEKLEGVYRNHIDEVYRFLEKKHKDHYKIYNLCSERSYDSSKFHERVERYAFEDHTPPNILMIQPFCEDVHNWLSADSKNVAAVHCKAGKGRTGTMVCCYLLYSRQKTTADEALKFYGTKRTHDEKGVTIPSQRRYVEYYAWLLHSGLKYVPTKMHIRELVMTPLPFQHAGHTVPELLITQADPFFKAPTGCHEVHRSETSLHVRLSHCTPLCGDVRVDVYNKHKMKMRKEKLFHFWFNTFFVAAGAGAVSHPPLPDSPNLETFKLTLNKWQLDDAHKDKQHKNYSQDFKVELIVQRMPESAVFSAGGASRAPSPPSSTASSCSDEPDAGWDSGERIPYARLPSATDDPRPPAHPFHKDGSDDLDPGYGPTDCNPLCCKDKRAGYESDALYKDLDKAGYRPTDPLFCKDLDRAGFEPTANPLYCGKGLDEASYEPSANPIYCAKDLDKNPIYCSKDLDKQAGFKPSPNPRYCKDLDKEVYEPTPNPIYCSKSLDDNAAAFYPECKDEPMEYSDVFSSAPTSARESPVEDKKRDDKTKPRLSLGDMRASWREFSGKFASDSRRRKDES